MSGGKGERINNLNFCIYLAGQCVAIHALSEEAYEYCKSYISKNVKANISIIVSQSDIACEKATAIKQIQRAGEFLNISPSYLETLAILRKIAESMLPYDTFLMHGVVISCQGQGYMIAAPSGVGKTTRAKLWVEHIPDSFVVNGDKPLLRVEESGVRAFGTPWCGKEGWNANTSVPLRAIFLLERSDGGNKVEEMSFGEAFPALLRQTYRPVDSQTRRKTLSLLQAMASKVKLYRFCSEPTAEAVRLAWETAGEKR